MPAPDAPQPRCGHVVGPVWKDGGESWACELPAGHDLADGHEARYSADRPGRVWWTHPERGAESVSRVPATPGHQPAPERPPTTTTHAPAAKPAITARHRNEDT